MESIRNFCRRNLFEAPTAEQKFEVGLLCKRGTSNIYFDRHVKAPLQGLTALFAAFVDVPAAPIKGLGRASICLLKENSLKKARQESISGLKVGGRSISQIAVLFVAISAGILFPNLVYRQLQRLSGSGVETEKRQTTQKSQDVQKEKQEKLLKEVNAQLKTKNAEISKLQERIQKLEKDQKSKDDTIPKGDISSLNAKLNEDLAIKSKEVSTLTGSVNTLEEDKLQAAQKIQDLQKEVETNKAQLLESNKKLSVQQTVWENKFSALEERLKTVNKDKEKQAKQIAEGKKLNQKSVEQQGKLLTDLNKQVKLNRNQKQKIDELQKASSKEIEKNPLAEINQNTSSQKFSNNSSVQSVAI